MKRVSLQKSFKFYESELKEEIYIYTRMYIDS